MTEEQAQVLKLLQDAFKALQDANQAMGNLSPQLAHSGYLRGAIESVEMLIDELEFLR